MDKINYDSLSLRQLRTIENHLSNLLFELLSINSFKEAQTINNELAFINTTIKQNLLNNLYNKDEYSNIMKNIKD